MNWLIQCVATEYWNWAVSHPIAAGAVFGLCVYMIGVEAADNWYDRKIRITAYRAAVAREKALTAR